MAHDDRRTGETIGAGSVASRVLMTIVRLMMLPILLIGLTAWGIVMAVAVVSSAIMGGVARVAQFLRSERVVTLPSGRGQPAKSS